MWIFDSWNAVAIAIVVARGGNPRRWAMAAISVVHRACSLSICARVSPTSATQYSLRTGSRSRITVATSTPATSSPARRTQRNLIVRVSIGVQVGVELDAAAVAPGRASSTPVSELVRNKMPSWPESWAALTTVPSGIRTLLPAVT